MRAQIVMSVTCLVIAVGAVAIAGWVLISGAIGAEGIDALFLITVCLLIAAAFAFIPIQDYRAGLFRAWIGKKQSPAQSEAAHPEPLAEPKAERGASGGSQ